MIFLFFVILLSLLLFFTILLFLSFYFLCHSHSLFFLITFLYYPHSCFFIILRLFFSFFLSNLFPSFINFSSFLLSISSYILLSIFPSPFFQSQFFPFLLFSILPLFLVIRKRLNEKRNDKKNENKKGAKKNDRGIKIFTSTKEGFYMNNN